MSKKYLSSLFGLPPSPDLAPDDSDHWHQKVVVVVQSAPANKKQPAKKNPHILFAALGSCGVIYARNFLALFFKHFSSANFRDKNTFLF